MPIAAISLGKRCEKGSRYEILTVFEPFEVGWPLDVADTRPE
jgi:hypothetical protein